jgi:hypothetical protein
MFKKTSFAAARTMMLIHSPNDWTPFCFISQRDPM